MVSSKIRINIINGKWNVQIHVENAKWFSVRQWIDLSGHLEKNDTTRLYPLFYNHKEPLKTAELKWNGVHDDIYVTGCIGSCQCFTSYEGIINMTSFPFQWGYILWFYWNKFVSLNDCLNKYLGWANICHNHRLCEPRIIMSCLPIF